MEECAAMERRTRLGAAGAPEGFRLWTLATLVVAVLCAFATPARAITLGQIHEFTGGLQSGSAPFAIAQGADGNMWFTDIGETPEIGKITPGGQITESAGGLLAGTEPGYIALGPDGNMWFTDLGGPQAVGRVTPSGQISEFQTGLNSGAQLMGIAPGADGNVWFVDQGQTPGIGRIRPSGSIHMFKQGLGGLVPRFIARGADGNMWFTAYGSGGAAAIGKITPGGQISIYTSTLNDGAVPTEIAPGPNGNMWFTDQGTTVTIGQVTPQGVITEPTTGLGSTPGPSRFAKQPAELPQGIVAGQNGDMWFTDAGTNFAVGKMTLEGQVREYKTGLATGASPEEIAAGSDGNLWFTDNGLGGRRGTSAIGRIGTGEPAAESSAATIIGSGEAGSQQTCAAHWSSWDSLAPSSSLFGFDHYQWLLDGSPLAGQRAVIYTPTTSQIGHALSCQVTATYPIPFLITASASSAAVTVAAVPTPKLTRLRISPHTFALTGRRVSGTCEPLAHANRGKQHCRRPVKLTISYDLNLAATVAFTIKHATTGRLVGGVCAARTHANRAQKHCVRLVALHGSIGQAGPAGANTLQFDGQVGGHRLAAGAYRISATPTAGGKSGVTQTIEFRLTA